MPDKTTPPEPPTATRSKSARASRDAELSAIDRHSKVTAKHSSATSATAINRVWDIGAVIGSAMRETERLTVLERDLSKSTPAAKARLGLLGDIATACLAEIVAHTTQTILRGAPATGSGQR